MTSTVNGWRKVLIDRCKTAQDPDRLPLHFVYVLLREELFERVLVDGSWWVKASQKGIEALGSEGGAA
jgi:hypothetical protein